MGFTRTSVDGLDQAGLVLWPMPGGYSVANIVPLRSGALGCDAYNALLADFQARIALPAAKASGYEVEVTAATEALTDWLSTEAASAFRRFSTMANKSTGSAHPMDQKRWLDFVILAHKGQKPLSASKLGRWLVEIERWPEDSAQSLVSEYEFALDLLTQCDQVNQ